MSSDDDKQLQFHAPSNWCDWCMSDATEVVGREYNGWAIMVCRNCGHEFMNPDDVYEELAKEWEDLDFSQIFEEEDK